MKQNTFLISTTNNIEGCPIKKYIGAICSNIVIGTNVFSDFAASFTDFFGGRSDSYKRKLEIIYDEASKELKQKAINVGANCIIGFKVDFDEISGKDKSMFMVSVSGTACVVDYPENANDNEFKSEIVNQSDLDKEIYRRTVIDSINNDIAISEDWIEFLLENPQVEIISKLLKKHSSCYTAYDEEAPKLEKLLLSYPKDKLIPIIYSDELFEHKSYRYIITKGKYFDAKSILRIFDIDIHVAIFLLEAKSDYYTKEDLSYMKQIVDKLDHMPDTGKIESVKGGLLGKEQMRFICEKGHKNNPDADFCSCGINIKGLTKEEVNIISNFKVRVKTLEELLKA
jgi:uncharacterized protein YbjQ (UPF0145 family)